MSLRFHIQFIRRHASEGGQPEITHIGGRHPDGGRWTLTREEAIRAIEGGAWQFYVSRGSKSADVIVVERDGRKVLETNAGGTAAHDLSLARFDTGD